MSDLGRKPVSDKISEAVKPDSEKSTLEKTKETVTGSVDKFAAHNVPDNQKSFSQTIADNVQTGHDDAKKAANEHEATLSETATEYLEAAKVKAAEAAQYVSGVVTGATEGAKDAHSEVKK